MPDVACKICGSEFYVKPVHQKKGWGKYCSVACRTKSQFNGKIVACFICRKEIYRSARDLKTSSSGLFFCSKSCQTIWRNKILFSGENHASWKYGESAYRRILSSTDKKKTCVLCKSEDFRVLAVHHLDKNRKNNDVSNLTWLCHNCHYLVHHYKEAQAKLREIRWM